MMRRSWLLQVMMLAASPQLAQAQPESDTIARAATARDAGDYRTAAALLETERSDRPEDPLVLRLLGAAYAYGGEYDKAILVLERAHSIAPADQDIALMLARSYHWAGRHVEAEAAVQAIAIADPANKELLQLREAIAAAAIDPPMQHSQRLLNFTQGLSNVRIGSANNSWHQTVVGLTLPIAVNATLSGTIDRESRAGPVDTRIDLRAETGLGSGKSGYASISFTPNADFREKWGMRAGGEASVTKIANITADLRYAEYGSTKIVAIEPGVRFHSASDHLSLALKSINLWTENDGYRSGWSMRGEVQTIKSVRLVAGGATYPDAEAGVIRRTRAAYAGAVFQLSDGIILRTFYEYERRTLSYTRNGLAFALSVKF